MSASAPRRIAVLRYRFIGDTLLTLPFLKALRARYPDGDITLYLGAAELPLVASCPDINHAEAFEPREMGFSASAKRLRAGRYDVIYLLKRSFSAALMAWMAGIPRRIGFDTEHRGMLLTQRVPYRAPARHEAACYLDLLGEPLNPDTNLAEAKSWLIPATVQAEMAARLATTPGPRVVLHGTSTNMRKAWPLEQWIQLAKALLAEFPAVQLFAMGTQPDFALYLALQASLPKADRGRFHNWCGRTTLIETLAALTEMALVVANDSGMIHMAAVADVPTVALFGPTDPTQWRPLNPHAIVLCPDPDLTPPNRRTTMNRGQSGPSLQLLPSDVVFQTCKPLLTSWNGPLS